MINMMDGRMEQKRECPFLCLWGFFSHEKFTLFKCVHKYLSVMSDGGLWTSIPTAL